MIRGVYLPPEPNNNNTLWIYILRPFCVGKISCDIIEIFGAEAQNQSQNLDGKFMIERRRNAKAISNPRIYTNV